MQLPSSAFWNTMAKVVNTNWHHALGYAVPVSVPNVTVPLVSTNSASFSTSLKAAKGDSNIISRRLRRLGGLSSSSTHIANRSSSIVARSLIARSCHFSGGELTATRFPAFLQYCHWIFKSNADVRRIVSELGPKDGISSGLHLYKQTYAPDLERPGGSDL